MRQILNPAGRAGCVLPSGIATDDTTKFFFQDVVETRSLVSLFDFENREELFTAVHREQKFCLYRAKRVILEIYDAMLAATRTGQPYQTILDPPPADPRVAHPPREASK